MTNDKALKKSIRGRMAETGESYTAARSRVLARTTDRQVAVTNGDSVAGTLRKAKLAPEVIVWGDVLHYGPVPDLAPARLRKLRAAHLAQLGGEPAALIERRLRERDQALARAAGVRLTLWFEADLYDQLQMIQVLSRLDGRSRISLISVGEHPDRPHFGGLGELTGEQLAGLVPAARPVTAAGLELAARAWSAFTADTPERLAALAGIVSSELRFVGEAIGRLLQEYPGVRDGLSLTQRRILLAVAGGLATLPELLRGHWTSEPRPFMGDTVLAAQLRVLASGPSRALVKQDGHHRLTPFGERLLAGEADWARASGAHRWLGGVQLDAGNPWRYDERLERLVRAT